MVKLAKHEVIKMQIKRIEKEIRDTPYHKGTEHHIGRLRAKLSKLKDSLEVPSGKKGGGGGYAVKKQGDATVVLVGPPSVGKSTLLNKLTNAKSKIAPYAFTTVSVIPGMLKHKEANIQILDVPGLIEGAEEGKGRGKEVLSVVRGADLLILMTEVLKEKIIPEIKEMLERNGIRLNKVPPNVVIEKKIGGGISVHSNFKDGISNETVKEMAREYGLKNAEITIKEELDMDRLIDSFSTNRVYIPFITVINKVDLAKKKTNKEDFLYISAENYKNIEKLKDIIWEKLEFVRVYLVRKDEEPSLDNPLVVKRNDSLLTVSKKIGEDFAEGKERAKIWGEGAKHPGQEVPLSTKVQEGMQVRFI